MRKLEKSLSSV